MRNDFVQQTIDGSNPIVVSSKKILYLKLMKKWFDQILKGIKKVEYREVKPYYISRLFDRHGILISYDYIVFKNGYSRKSPILMVEYNGVVGIVDFDGVECFKIALGRALNEGVAESSLTTNKGVE